MKLVKLVPALVAALLATAVAVPAQAQKKGGDVVVGLYGNVTSIDSQFTTNQISRSMLMGVYEGLVTVDENTNVIPMLADHWDISPDGLTYRFTLRQGVKFHNGKEMTSADVKASLDRFAKVSPDQTTMAPVASIEATSPYVVTITLKQATPLFLQRLASPSAPASIIPAEEAAKDLNKAGNIGTGPLEFVDWQPGNYLKLKRYDGYVPNTSFPGPTGFGGKKTEYFDTVTFRFIIEDGARVAALEAGEIQLAENVPVPASKRLATNPAIKMYQLDTFNMPVLFINHSLPPTDNLKFRQAVQAALDNDEIMGGATDGLYGLDPSWLWSTNPLYSTAGKELYDINNVDRAKALLKDSGYKGEPVIFNISNISFHTKIGTIVLAELQAAGINVVAHNVDFPTLLAAAGTDTGWNLATNGFSSQPYLGGYAYQSFFTGASNWGRVKSEPAMDAAWAKFNAATDAAGSKAAWAAIQQQSYDNVDIIKLGNQGFLIGASTKLQGYKPYVGAERMWDVRYQ